MDIALSGNVRFFSGFDSLNAPGAIGTIHGTEIHIVQNPEPNAALGLGLGLSALSMTGRRRRHATR